MKRNRLLMVLLLTLVLVIIAGGWLAWYQTLPVYDAAQRASADDDRPIVLYLFNATLPNAMDTLRYGLMNGLARSGNLPKGYPKFIAASWGEGCKDKTLLAGSRYFIELSETEGNYFEFPICPLSAMLNEINIYILPAWPWAKMTEGMPEITIGFNRIGHSYLKPGQLELIFEVLKGMGVKVHSDDDLRNFGNRQ
jgi:hypothetical protein